MVVADQRLKYSSSLDDIKYNDDQSDNQQNVDKSAQSVWGHQA